MIAAEGAYELNRRMKVLAGPCPECHSTEVTIIHGYDQAAAQCKACAHVWPVRRPEN